MQAILVDVRGAAPLSHSFSGTVDLLDAQFLAGFLNWEIYQDNNGLNLQAVAALLSHFFSGAVDTTLSLLPACRNRDSLAAFKQFKFEIIETLLGC